MRRLSPCLLTALALALVACGDNADNVGDDRAATQPATQASTQPAGSGRRKVEAPQPRPDGKLDRPKTSIDRGKEYTAILKTTCGDITIRLAAGRAPKTVSSFVALARDDFYDGLTFHRVVPGFVAQGGDPQGKGLGGPGYKVVEAPPPGTAYTRGVVAMAKGVQERPGTSGSQFFIVTGPDAGLDPDYALLGKVEGSTEALERLAEVPVVPMDPEDPTVDNRPVEPVVIEDVEIREG